MVTTRSKRARADDTSTSEEFIGIRERMGKKKSKSQGHVATSKYSFMDLPPEIRLSIYHLVLAPFEGMIVSPRALLDLPLPGLDVGLLLVSREIAREAYEVFGAITKLKLHMYRPTTVTLLELLWQGERIDSDYEELFGHLPFFKDVTLISGGAKRTDIDMLQHLTMLIGMFMNHINTRTAHLKIQFPEAALYHYSEETRLERWNEMCLQLGELAKKIHTHGGDLLVQYETHGIKFHWIPEEVNRVANRATAPVTVHALRAAADTFGYRVEAYQRDLLSRRHYGPNYRRLGHGPPHRRQ